MALSRRGVCSQKKKKNQIRCKDVLDGRRDIRGPGRNAIVCAERHARRDQFRSRLSRIRERSRVAPAASESRAGESRRRSYASVKQKQTRYDDFRHLRVQWSFQECLVARPSHSKIMGVIIVGFSLRFLSNS